ncbi:MAG: imidazole glycerol phosphate synthase subunit HisH [Gemmatimonadota bacterium]
MRVALFDYGVGNLHSLAKALQAGGAEVDVETEITSALRKDALILPGVGAFGPAAAALLPLAPSLRSALSAGHPCLGICLGMQLLFDSSDEGLGMGLGVMRGHVRRLRSRRVPHMGWNQVEPVRADPLFDGITRMSAYFANSFVAEPANPGDVIAWTEYEGQQFASAIRRDRAWGVQFHPEKSGQTGVQLIRNFLTSARA